MGGSAPPYGFHLASIPRCQMWWKSYNIVLIDIIPVIVGEKFFFSYNPLFIIYTPKGQMVNILLFALIQQIREVAISSGS